MSRAAKAEQKAGTAPLGDGEQGAGAEQGHPGDAQEHDAGDRARLWRCCRYGQDVQWGQLRYLGKRCGRDLPLPGARLQEKGLDREVPCFLPFLPRPFQALAAGKMSGSNHDVDAVDGAHAVLPDHESECNRLAGAHRG